ncbi:MAG: CvpA family protein [Chloroflexota bacterium]|nr:MAG: CvpA family protein [Chloroflexota bacterium]
MAGLNWLDLIILLLLLTGMAIGFAQGLVRQVIGLVALYIGLVLATQFFRPLSQLTGDALNTTPNTLSNAVAFFAILFLAIGVINFFALDAYKSTKIRLVPAVDQVTGIALGVISMWIVLSVAVNVLDFAVHAQTWTGNAETARNIILNGLENSRLAEVTASTLPMIVTTIRPWLPGGLPTIFNI